MSSSFLEILAPCRCFIILLSFDNKETSPPKVTWEESVAVFIGYNGCSKFTLNCPFPFDDHHPHLIHTSLDRPHSPPQTASGSNQPFATVHFPGRQTDRQTDRWVGDSCVARALTLYLNSAYVVLYQYNTA